MATKTEWVPVDAYFEIDAGTDQTISFETNGEMDAIRDSGWRADNRVSISGKLPDDYRLCRRVTAEIPDAGAMPDAAREVMGKALRFMIEDMGHLGIEEHAPSYDHAKEALEWLEAQKRSGGDGAS